MTQSTAIETYAKLVKFAEKEEYKNPEDDREFVPRSKLEHPAVSRMRTGLGVGEGLGTVGGALAGFILGMKNIGKPNLAFTNNPGLNNLLTGVAYPAVGGTLGGILGGHIGGGIGALTGTGKKTREGWHEKMKDYRENPNKYYFEPEEDSEEKEASAMQKTAALEAYATMLEKVARRDPDEVDKMHPALRGMRKGMARGAGIGGGIGATLGGLRGAATGEYGPAIAGLLSGGATGALAGGTLGGGIGALSGRRRAAKWHEDMKKKAGEENEETGRMHPALRRMLAGLAIGGGVGLAGGTAESLARGFEPGYGVANALAGMGGGAAIGGGIGALSAGKGVRQRWHKGNQSEGKTACATYAEILNR